MGLTAKELSDGIDRCIAHCIDTGEAPVGFVLHKFVDIPEAELTRYLEEGEKMRRGELRFSRSLDTRFLAARRWDEFKTFFWLDRAQRDPKNASFAMFNLKQSENGGYAEKEAKAGKSTVVIRLDGVGGREAME